MKLTVAQRRALEAVRDGKVRRTYTSKGNSFQTPEGVGAAAMWKLEGYGLIKDARGSARAAAFSSFVSVELTDAGRKALWHPEGR